MYEVSLVSVHADYMRRVDAIYPAQRYTMKKLLTVLASLEDIPILNIKINVSRRRHDMILEKHVNSLEEMLEVASMTQDLRVKIIGIINDCRRTQAIQQIANRLEHWRIIV